MKLGTTLPKTLDGYEAGKLDGGTLTMPNMEKPGDMFSYSTVEREFTAGRKNELS